MGAMPRGLPRLLKSLVLLSGWGVALWLVSIGVDHKPLVAPVVPGPLERVMAELEEDRSLSGAALAFCVLGEDGQVMGSSALAETSLAPASALKTLTTGAALEILGPEFRFETTLAATAAPDAHGLLAGDLVLVGGGDPTTSASDLDALAAAAAAAGLKRVAGNLVMDATIFPVNPVSDHWNWGDVGNGYGVGAYGINVDHNILSVAFAPGASPGSPAAIVEATAAPVVWVNEVVTGPPGSGDRVVAYSEPYGERITLRGSVPLDQPKFRVRVANPNPPASARTLLAQALKRHGIELVGSASGADRSGTGRTVLARHQSAPLAEIIEHLHRVSDNLESQCLFLLMGQRAGKDPAAALQAFWESRGVEFAGLRILDGSGLARANMIRACDLAAVNHRAGTGKYAEIFRQSLSAYDGPNGGVRAKLGAMSGVRTEVGFLTGRGGQRLTYALMASGLPPGANLGRVRSSLLDIAAGL